MSFKKKSCVVWLSLMMFLSPLLGLVAFTPEEIEAKYVSDFLQDATFVSTAYGVGLWGSSSIGNLMDGATDTLFQNVLMPLGVRFLWGIHYNDGSLWATGLGNTSDTNITNNTKIHTLLGLADKYGVAVTFSAPLKDYDDANWVDEWLDDYPELTTYDDTGTAYTDDFIRVDSENITNALYQDLIQLWSYYGQYQSWIGFGTVGASDGDGYTGSINRVGWQVHQMHNDTLLNYTNSRWYVSHAGCNLTWTNATTPEKYADLVANHDGTTNSFELFIQDQQHRVYIEVAEMFAAYTGRSWLVTSPVSNGADMDPKEFFAERDMDNVSAKVNIIEASGLLMDDTQTAWRLYFSNVGTDALQYGSNRVFLWGSLSSDADMPRNLTPEQIGEQYLMTLPFSSGRSMFTLDFVWGTGNNGIQNNTEQANARYFGTILERMRNVGGYFGEENNRVKALLITDTARNSFQYLTPAINLTVYEATAAGGPNLTRYNDFTQFDAIIITGDNAPFSMSANAKKRVRDYVWGGGGLVWADGWDYTAADWNYTLGFNPVSDAAPAAGGYTVVNADHPILQPYGSGTIGNGFHWYRRAAVRFEKIGNESGVGVINDTNRGAILFTNEHGGGRTAFIPWGQSSWQTIGAGGAVATYLAGSPKDSFMVLVTNAVLWVAGETGATPAWWYDSSRGWTQAHSWSDEIYYSIRGGNGAPVLVWLTSNDTAASSFEIHLNATYFGVDSTGWVAVNMLDMSVVNMSTGVDIEINFSVPAKTWTPIYICNLSSTLDSVYSNGKIVSESVGMVQGVYEVRGHYNQTAWLLLNTPNNLTSVTSNVTGALTHALSLANLNTSASEGWFYDSSTNVTYIKFRTTSTVEITAMLNAVITAIKVEDAGGNPLNLRTYIHANATQEELVDASGYVYFYNLTAGIYNVTAQWQNSTVANGYVQVNGSDFAAVTASAVSQTVLVRLSVYRITVRTLANNGLPVGVNNLTYTAANNGSSRAVLNGAGQGVFLVGNGTNTPTDIFYGNNNVRANVTDTFAVSTYDKTYEWDVYVYYRALTYRDLGAVAVAAGNLDSYSVVAPNSTLVTGLTPTTSYYYQNGTFTVKTILWHGINVTHSNTSYDPVTGNPPIVLRLLRKVSRGTGYIGINDTITGITLNRDVESNITFTAVGGAGTNYRIVMDSTAEPTALTKDGGAESFIYSAVNQRVTVDTVGFSVFTFTYPGATTTTSTVATPTMSSPQVRSLYSGNLLEAIFSPFTVIMGNWIFAILFGVAFAMIWFKTQNAMVPSVTFILISPIVLYFLPAGAASIYYAFLALSVAAVLYQVYTHRGG